MKSKLMRAMMLLVVSSLVLTSCGLVPGAAAPTSDPGVFFTQAAETMSVELTLIALGNIPVDPTSTPMPPPTDTPMPPPTEDPALIPTLTLSPLDILPTETPEPPPTPETPFLSVTENTNCRAGPSPIFRVEGYVTTDMSLPVRGVSEGRSWWWVDNPTYPGYHCWVWKYTSVVEGDTSEVPVYREPWTPTPGEAVMSASIVTGPSEVVGKCPLKVKFGAVIHTNTGGQVHYEWVKKGGNKSDKGWVTIAADSQATVIWSFYVSNSGDQYVRFKVDYPTHLDPVTKKFTVKCMR
jgi:hypothetical protein